MASSGLGSGVDDRFAPTVCTTARYKQEEAKVANYPPWYNGPQEGEWDANSRVHSFVDDRFGTEYSDFSRTTSHGVSSGAQQEPLTQNMLKKLQRATIENRLRAEAETQKARADSKAGIQDTRHVQTKASKTERAELKPTRKINIRPLSYKANREDAKDSTRAKDGTSPIKVATGLAKGDCVQTYKSNTADKGAPPLSTSSRPQGSRTIRLVAKDGRESYVQIPVHGTIVQSAPNAINNMEDDVGKDKKYVRSVVLPKTLESKAKQEKQDGRRSSAARMKDLKPVTPELVRQNAEPKLASSHKDNSASKPQSLARVALSISKIQVIEKESKKLGEEGRPAAEHAASLNSSTTDSAVAFDPPLQRESPPFQRSPAPAHSSPHTEKKVSKADDLQASYQPSHNGSRSARLDAPSHRPQSGSSQSKESSPGEAQTDHHSKSSGESGLTSDTPANHKTELSESNSRTQDVYKKSSSTLEHSFARMGAFAPVPVDSGSSQKRTSASTSTSTVQPASSSPPHKPQTIFAGRGWVTPHPLSEVGPPQSVIELRDKSGGALRISFEDFKGIAGSEARQYVHSHHNGASSSLHSRQMNGQDRRETRPGSSYGTHSSGRPSHQVYSYDTSSYGQPSNYHIPTVESTRSSPQGMAAQTYLYRPAVVYGSYQGYDVVFDAPPSESHGTSVTQQLYSPGVENSRHTPTLYTIQDESPPARTASFRIVPTDNASSSRSYASPGCLQEGASVGRYHGLQVEQRQQLSPNAPAPSAAFNRQHDIYNDRQHSPYNHTAPSLTQSMTASPKIVSRPLVIPLPNGQVQLSMPWDADTDRHGSLREYRRSRDSEPSFESATTIPDTEVYVHEEGDSAPSKWSSVDRAERGYGSFRPAMW